MRVEITSAFYVRPNKQVSVQSKINNSELNTQPAFSGRKMNITALVALALGAVIAPGEIEKHNQRVAAERTANDTRATKAEQRTAKAEQKIKDLEKLIQGIKTDQIDPEVAKRVLQDQDIAKVVADVTEVKDKQTGYEQKLARLESQQSASDREFNRRLADQEIQVMNFGGDVMQLKGNLDVTNSKVAQMGKDVKAISALTVDDQKWIQEIAPSTGMVTVWTATKTTPTKMVLNRTSAGSGFLFWGKQKGKDKSPQWYWLTNDHVVEEGVKTAPTLPPHMSIKYYVQPDVKSDKWLRCDLLPVHSTRGATDFRVFKVANSKTIEPENRPEYETYEKNAKPVRWLYNARPWERLEKVASVMSPAAMYSTASVGTVAHPDRKVNISVRNTVQLSLPQAKGGSSGAAVMRRTPEGLSYVGGQIFGGPTDNTSSLANDAKHIILGLIDQGIEPYNYVDGKFELVLPAGKERKQALAQYRKEQPGIEAKAADMRKQLASEEADEQAEAERNGKRLAAVDVLQKEVARLRLERLQDKGVPNFIAAMGHVPIGNGPFLNAAMYKSAYDLNPLNQHRPSAPPPMPMPPKFKHIPPSRPRRRLVGTGREHRLKF